MTQPSITALPTPRASIGVVTEELIFAVSNRIGMSFGDVANVLFGAQAHMSESASAPVSALQTQHIARRRTA